ncbi:MAG: DUF1592 domain-containing protein [Myxococcota bacterium]
MSRIPPLAACLLLCACYSGPRNDGDGGPGIDTLGGDDGVGGDDAGDHPAAQCEDVDPGTVVMHRLNRAEYDNTIRDLLGVDLDLAESFPAESHVEGFDNNAQALTVSPLHVEKYLAAAAEAVTAAMADATIAEQLVFCAPAGDDIRGCAEPVVRAILPRAYRRPVTDDEVARLVAVVEQTVADGDSFELGVELALRTMLVSPHFLFRPEPPPEGADGDGAYRLPPYALASRLSYFLWSSMPDEALFAAAESGALSDHEEIDNQVRRMLADPKAEAFTRNFVGQWLHARAMVEAHPDADTFPDFDEPLRAAMEEEAYRFFETIIAEDRPASDLLLADFALVDQRLAQHYGLAADGLGAGQFQAVPVDPSQRGGVLRQGSFLTVTSHPTRTSAVKRGKWVIEQLLCTTPPPPPPGVEDLPQDVDENATAREVFEQHRADPACAACHALMDPIGFSLENYDAVGAYRTMDNGQPLDTAGELEGIAFEDAADLSQILAEDPRYLPCVTQKVFTYALGRAPDAGDRCTIDAIAEELEHRDDNLIEMLILVAQSPAATQRQDG